MFIHVKIWFAIKEKRIMKFGEEKAESEKSPVRTQVFFILLVFSGRSLSSVPEELTNSVELSTTQEITSSAATR
jgi:hypothetical protein